MPWGPSPGFRELRWIRPVLAGDTLSFASVVETRRASDSRPEWGIVEIRNTGTNQRGELVFSFLGAAFVPRRNAGLTRNKVTASFGRLLRMDSAERMFC